MRAGGATPKAGLAVGLGLILLAAVIGFDTAGMQVPPTYARVGPQIFPYLAAIALAACGLFFIWQVFAGGKDAIAPDSTAADWVAVIAISAGLLLQVVLIQRFGFIISAALLFFAVAWGFRSKRPLRDAIVAVLLSLVVYFVFTRLLNLQLPAGIFKGVF